MKKLYIIKAGTTFSSTRNQFGDFDRWTATALGSVDLEIVIVDAEQGDPLPPEGECAGVVITGSHAMVTDNLPWSVRLEKWIASLLRASTPIFGICYGHQLLARAAGGRVGFHPDGIEIGTMRVQLLPDCATDPIFRSLPQSFLVHVTHSQTVLEPPKGVTRLAAGTHEPNHAFRVGNCAWGVQFHPEFSSDIMRSYIKEEAGEIASAGLDVSQLLDGVSETPIAAQTLKRFAWFVNNRLNKREMQPTGNTGDEFDCN
jgi:GMP synthase (glutamine-hydrolysing)